MNQLFKPPVSTKNIFYLLTLLLIFVCFVFVLSLDFIIPTIILITLSIVGYRMHKGKSITAVSRLLTVAISIIICIVIYGWIEEINSFNPTKVNYVFNFFVYPAFLIILGVSIYLNYKLNSKHNQQFGFKTIKYADATDSERAVLLLRERAKTKRIVLQMALTLLAMISIWFISMSFVFEDMSDFGVYLYDEFTSLNVGLVASAIYFIMPVLFTLSLFRRHKQTPSLDNTVRIVLYVSALMLLVNTFYHFEYMWLNDVESDWWYYFWTEPFRGEYFWLYMVLAGVCHLVPATLFFAAAKIGSDGANRE